MRRTNTGRGKRAGFTLVELLIVIAIIAILVGLVATAVMRALSKGPETQARTEIGQMETALQACMTEFNLDYLPSSLILREDNAYYDAAGNPLPGYQPTVTFLTKMFGKRVNLKPPMTIDWNGDTSISNQDIVMEGQHCLVFFLGGIPVPATPSGASGSGFAADPVNPANAAAPTRKGPYYQFPASRLVMGTSTGHNFYVFVDPYSGSPRPYAYFSSYNKLNGYRNDCPSLGVSPYFHMGSNNIRMYENGRSYQILSAGKDNTFGPGGQWDPTSGVTSGPGSDDQSNFAGRILGSP